MGKRNMRVRNVQRSANGAVGIKAEACSAVDCETQGIRRSGNVSFLNDGFCRNVYVNDSRTIVYKVAKRRNEANISEFENMVAMRSDPETRKYHTPLTLMMVDGIAVIAMVFRPNHAHECSDHDRRNFRKVAARKGMHDMHDENYRGTPTGRVKVTDIGDVL